MCFRLGIPISFDGRKEGDGLTDYIVVHDVGTTGVKSCLFDNRGRLIGQHYTPLTTRYPGPRIALQRPRDWYRSICSGTRALLELTGIQPGSVAGVSFSTHCPSLVLVDKDGQLLVEDIPIYGDLRALDQTRRFLEKLGGWARFYDLTGAGNLTEQYQLFKILWFRDEATDLFQRTRYFLNTADYLVYRLTGRFVTDYSLASNTGMLSIGDKNWCAEIIETAGINPDRLPRLVQSTDRVGQLSEAAARDSGLTTGTPVIMGGADVSCATLGAGVIEEGVGYAYLGSAAWIGVASKHPILDHETRMAHFRHLAPDQFAIHLFMTGAGICYQWLRDNLYAAGCGGHDPDELYPSMNKMAASVPPGSEKLVFLPYMRGVWAGNTNPNTRGSYIGLGLHHTPAHLFRAAIEGLAFGLKDLKEKFESRNLPLKELRVIGGGAKSELWLQIIADVCGLPVGCLQYIQEAGSFGAAVAAGIGLGMYPDFQVAKDFNPVTHTRNVQADIHEFYEKLYPVFKCAYESNYRLCDQLAGIG